MKGSSSEILVKYLENEGVEFIFGVPGGHLLPLYDALYKNGKIKPILTKHEAGAAFMAYGYAVTSGKIGVCCGTVGPGATNLITGVAAAYMDSVPILALTAQVGTTSIGKGALQEGSGIGRTVDHLALFKNITKISTRELRGVNIPDAIRRAIRVAVSGRPGPAHIDLPADVQGERIDVDILPPESYRPVRKGAADISAIKVASNYLSSASKPAILLGYGAAVSIADRKENIIELAERLGAPVATTLRAKGIFPEDHPLSLGCVGLYGTRAANSYLRSNIDVLLSLGTSFHEFSSHCWDEAFIPSTALIQVDIDSSEIGKIYPVKVALVGEVQPVLTSLLEELNTRQISIDDIIAFKNENEYFSEKAMFSDSVPVKPQRLMKDLRDALPRDVIVFADIGNTLTWAERYFQAYSEGQFIALSGLAAMGSATAACIGGKLGSPRKPVVCMCGDGDFLMTGMEVGTAASHEVPVIWVILKNSRLGMIYDVQSVSYQNRYISATFSDTDYVLLAQALGGKGYRVRTPSEIGPTINKALKEQGPVVVEVIIDNTELPPMKPRMMALRRSLGLPSPMKSFSLDSLKALWRMVTER